MIASRILRATANRAHRDSVNNHRQVCFQDRMFTNDRFTVHKFHHTICPANGFKICVLTAGVPAVLPHVPARRTRGTAGAGSLSSWTSAIVRYRMTKAARPTVSHSVTIAHHKFCRQENANTTISLNFVSIRPRHCEQNHSMSRPIARHSQLSSGAFGTGSSSVTAEVDWPRHVGSRRANCRKLLRQGQLVCCCRTEID